jgi:D-beta-D-heptose 7-phosphate kinase/D-beta-D-heptose 1-phosphate adenosyltransferase
MVVGDLMADKYVWADGQAPLRAATAILKVRREVYALGGAANVAHNLRALGSEVFLCGIVGYDDAAHWFRRGCHEAGIDTSGIFPVNDRPTTLKVRLMTEGQPSPLLRIDYERTEAPDPSELASMLTYVEHYLPMVDALVLSDYDKGIFGSSDFTRGLVERALRHQKVTVIELKAGRLDCCKGAHLVILSELEAQDLSLQTLGPLACEGAAFGDRLREVLGCGALAVLRSEEELWYHYREGETDRHVVEAVDHQMVRDATGVKDTIKGALTLALIAGADPPVAARLAIKAAERVVSRIGTATVSLAELRRML